MQSNKCSHCGGRMKKGKAIVSTATGTPDLSNGDVVTVSLGGPGKLIDVMECQQCRKILSMLSDAEYYENLLQHDACERIDQARYWVGV